MKLRVDVQRASDEPRAPAAAAVRRWAAAAARAAGGAGFAEVSVRLVDEDEGADLNGAYRGRAGATNVLSFPFDAAERTDPPLLGDVVVCAPVVVREAAAQGKDADAHFAHMVVHGVLHLLGHEHGDDARAAVMEDVERRVLGELGYPDPYAERVDALP